MPGGTETGGSKDATAIIGSGDDSTQVCFDRPALMLLCMAHYSPDIFCLISSREVNRYLRVT